MPYHMPFRSGTSPLAWEPDAEREAERRAEIEQLLRMQQKVQLRLNPDAPLDVCRCRFGGGDAMSALNDRR